MTDSINIWVMNKGVYMAGRFVDNVFDGLHNEIARLHMMLTETNDMKRVLFPVDKREQLVSQLIQEYHEVGYTVEMMLREGHVGYTNMTDIELLVDVQNTIAGWCGFEDNDDLNDYEFVMDMVKEAQKEVLCEAFEKSCL